MSKLLVLALCGCIVSGLDADVVSLIQGDVKVAPAQSSGVEVNGVVLARALLNAVSHDSSQETSRKLMANVPKIDLPPALGDAILKVGKMATKFLMKELNTNFAMNNETWANIVPHRTALREYVESMPQGEKTHEQLRGLFPHLYANLQACLTEQYRRAEQLDLTGKHLFDFYTTGPGSLLPAGDAIAKALWNREEYSRLNHTVTSHIEAAMRFVPDQAANLTHEEYTAALQKMMREHAVFFQEFKSFFQELLGKERGVSKDLQLLKETSMAPLYDDLAGLIEYSYTFIHTVVNNTKEWVDDMEGAMAEFGAKYKSGASRTSTGLLAILSLGILSRFW